MKVSNSRESVFPVCLNIWSSGGLREIIWVLKLHERFKEIILLERMFSVPPAEDVEKLVVNAYRDGEAHDCQGDGGDHRDDAELKQGK